MNNKIALPTILISCFLLSACGGGGSTSANDSDMSGSGKISHCKEYVIEELNTIERDERAFRDLSTSRYLINALNRAEYFLIHYSRDLDCLARDTETNLLMTIDRIYIKNVISTLHEKVRRLFARECNSSSLDFEQRMNCKKLKDAQN